MTLIAIGIIDDLPTPLSQLLELAVGKGAPAPRSRLQGWFAPRSAPRLPPNLLAILDLAALHDAREQLQRLPYVQHGLLSIDVREVHER